MPFQKSEIPEPSALAWETFKNSKRHGDLVCLLKRNPNAYPTIFEALFYHGFASGLEYSTQQIDETLAADSASMKQPA